MATAYASVGSDVQGLRAQLMDTYTWSEKVKKYSLKSSQFNFSVSLKDGAVPIEGSSVDRTGGRYLSVLSKEKVSFAGLGQVEASLSADEEVLSIFFSNKKKKEMLKSLVKSAGYRLPSEKDVFISDYVCTVNEDKALDCVFNYSL